MKGFIGLACVPLLASLAVAGPILEQRTAPAPLRVAPPNAKTNGGYIVVLKDDANPQEQVNALGLNSERRLPGVSVDKVLDGVVKGYAGKFDTATLDKIRADPKVAYVEPDIIMKASNVQQGAEYGLAISSQKTKLAYSNQKKYYYDAGAGSGVKVYVIDTGINVAHNEFQPGRAKMVANFVPNAPNDDDQGHGSHCAGTIAGKTYGIAKNATVLGVKVLDYEGVGATSTIISGVNYAVRHCGGTKCIISMSLGGDYSSAMNQAVDQAFANGVLPIVAAGNSGIDACAFSPASAANAITVGAIDWTYSKADFSNFGKCTDIFAPGVDVLSAYWGGKDTEKIMSGTSMATPHVAGIAATYLSMTQESPAQLTTRIINNSQKNLIIGPGAGSPNRLANNGYFIRHPNEKY